MQALETHHKTVVGELEGEVRALQEREAAKQATLDTSLEESQLREQVCTTTPATSPVSAPVQKALTVQEACRRWLHTTKYTTLVTLSLETMPCTQT
jgi:hypothetical protein